MGKNITIYVTDELLEKMNRFEEVNWSEIARKGIENYVDGRKKEVVTINRVPQTVVDEFRYFLDSFGKYTQGVYTYSILSIYQSFPAKITKRERAQFQDLFNTLRSDFHELVKHFHAFEKKKEIDSFNPLVDSLVRIVERYSKYVRSFASIVKETAKYLEAKIGESMDRKGAIEYPDTTYWIFREMYNYFIMALDRFLKATVSYHGRPIADWRVIDMLAPRLVQFRLYTEEPVVGI